MVDPVMAQDGNTYERSELETWLESSTTSPLDPSLQLSVSVLIPNRAVRDNVEALVESGDVDAELLESWRKRKKPFDMASAKELYDQDRVLEAAKLG